MHAGIGTKRIRRNPSAIRERSATVSAGPVAACEGGKGILNESLTMGGSAAAGSFDHSHTPAAGRFWRMPRFRASPAGLRLGIPVEISFIDLIAFL
jgi:hypothetical protein